MKRQGLIIAAALLFSLAGCNNGGPPGDEEATQALRHFVSPFRNAIPFPNAVVKIKNCEKSNEVAGYMCSIDWHEGDGDWITNRLAGFSQSKDGTWNVSQW